MSDATVRGRFVWHELMTSDTTSAAAFYAKVVGWKTKPWDQEPLYIMFLGGGRPMAGLMLIPEDAKAMGAPPRWMSYVGTPDVDETAKQAVSLGATVIKPPTDIPTIGRFAVLQDPQGAIFLAFTPVPSSQAPAQVAAAPAVGDFSWHELVTTDWKAALTFYGQLFGWEATSSMDMGPEMGTYQMFGWNGTTLGGMFNKTPHMPGPPAWLPYIKVQDAQAAVPTVKKLGGVVINGPMEVPGGDWIAQGLDLQGAMFAVHSAKPAAKQAVAKKAATPAAKKAAPAAKKATPAVTKAKAVKKAKAATKASPAAKKASVAIKKGKPAVRQAKPVARAAKKAVTRKAAKTVVKSRTSKATARSKPATKSAGTKRPAVKRASKSKATKKSKSKGLRRR